MMTRFIKKFNRPAILIGVLAVAIGILFLQRQGLLATERLWPDEALYASYAAEIFRQPLFVFSREANLHHAPLFSSLLALGHYWYDSILGDRIIVLCVNLLGVAGIFLLGRMLFGAFTGLVAAFMLAGSGAYLAQANLVLIDGTLTLAHLVFAAALWIHARSGRWQDGLFAGAAGVLIVLLKWYAALFVIPWMVLFYFFQRCEDWKNPARQAAIPVCLVFAAALPYIIFKLIPVLHNGGPATFAPKPFWYYLTLLPELLGGAVMAGLFLSGLFFLFQEEKGKKYLLLFWIIVEMAVLSLVAEKDIRYMMPILPALILIVALGVGHLLRTWIRTSWLQTTARVSVLLMLFIPILSVTENVGRASINYGYTGFREAGQVVKELDNGRALILTGSIRAMRYTTGIKEKEFGGRLMRLPETLGELKDILVMTKDKVILEVDRWEYIQPAWVYPVTEEKLDAIRALGFKDKAVVKKPLGRADPVAVVWVLER